MRHLFFWIITVPVAVVLVIFTMWNTQEITLNLWPLPWEAPLPAYALVFGALVIGFLAGVFVTWRHGSAGRRRHRDLNRRYSVQATELDTLRRQGNGQGTSTSRAPSTALAKTDPNALVPPAI